jgi:hypothetical protein
VRSLFLLLAACTQVDVAAILPVTGSDEDAGTLDAKPSIELCDGPVLVAGTSGEICGASVAESVFRFALCSCEDYVASSALTTDSFDSRIGPWVAGGTGGSVGIDRHPNFGGPVVIGGSLWVADPGGLQAGAAGSIDVAGELRSDGQLLSEASVRVDRDAWIGGRVMARDLYVGGTLRYPPNEPLDVAGTEQVAATERVEVSVAPPCDCSAGQIVDVAAFVARHASNNDNASIGLDAGALGNLAGPSRLELPCGRFYLDRIGGAGALTISVRGRAALFVDGDISLESTLIVEVIPGGELDLFVSGALVAQERFTIGSPDRPARARLYFGTTGSLQISGGALIAANVYAPTAELSASAPIEVFGSLFVRRLNTSADLTIHYDAAILTAAADCPAPSPAGCAACPDCTNDACHPVTSQCCAPLSCSGGTCVPEL